MNEDIKVSVYTACYNHAKYIRKCLDSLLMQKTSFKYEIIIIDDCSTDGTKEIIAEYAKEYPDIVKPIFNKENLYSKKIKKFKNIVLPRVRGKYIAYCEGDDFWTDENKLQLQFEAMENHPECLICVHRVQAVYENGKERADLTYPPCGLKHLKEGVVAADECAKLLIAKAIYVFQTSSFFIRTETSKKMNLYPPDFFSCARVGDVKILRYCINEGDVFFLDRYMSCYRTGSINSWVKRTSSNVDALNQHILDVIKMDQLYDEYTKGKFHNYVVEGCKRRNFDRCIRTYRFKELFTSDNKDFLKLIPLKRKVFYRILSFLPTKLSMALFKGM